MTIYKIKVKSLDFKKYKPGISMKNVRGTLMCGLQIDLFEYLKKNNDAMTRCKRLFSIIRNTQDLKIVKI